MGVKITKMQGCGNDFVILDYEEFVKFNLSMSDTAKNFVTDILVLALTALLFLIQM